MPEKTYYFKKRIVELLEGHGTPLTDGELTVQFEPAEDGKIWVEFCVYDTETKEPLVEVGRAKIGVGEVIHLSDIRETFKIYA
jgi:hypothetical protein